LGLGRAKRIQYPHSPSHHPVGHTLLESSPYPPLPISSASTPAPTPTPTLTPTNSPSPFLTRSPTADCTSTASQLAFGWLRLPPPVARRLLSSAPTLEASALVPDIHRHPLRIESCHVRCLPSAGRSSSLVLCCWSLVLETASPSPRPLDDAVVTSSPPSRLELEPLHRARTPLRRPTLLLFFERSRFEPFRACLSGP
jgi:hypothetical protein